MWREVCEIMYLPLRRIKKKGRNIYCKKMLLSVLKLENPHTGCTVLSHYPGLASGERRTAPYSSVKDRPLPTLSNRQSAV